ncbi:MAG: ParB/RepB/Spo0J family partition protein [Candidatus Dadabacteria bacterium]|nr:ParB/RepB/Spo0J family partition protein [Candidatus Dadabacteria bacterium]NIQ14229.1 ParB/RepB/Spo0J family partition protein [Candidatus Dadabacteria bacterium]
MRKPTLGKGLDALIPKEDKIEQSSHLIDIHNIIPNASQPRKNFDDISLNELAGSIKENGLIQPIVVRKKGNDYEIVAGERRWRASQIAGIKKIPVIIKEVSDENLLELALIENLQREDLNPIEEAEAYNKLMTDFKLTHDDISKKIGKNRSTITNMIRLLQLTDKAKKALISKEITAGHARALLGLESKSQIDKILDEIISKNHSVRKTEDIIKKYNYEKRERTSIKAGSKDSETNDYFVESLVDELRKTLGTKVKIKQSGKRGKIEIEYYSPEELDRLIGMILSNR